MPPRKTMRLSHRRSYRSRTTRRTSRSRASHTYYPCSSPKFSTVKTECKWRIGSYRNVYSQFSGASTKTIFSPTNASKWMRYVNNGARVYKFNNNQFTRYFGSQWTLNTRTARQYLRRKFGPSIKDVIRGKGNCWLVATTKSVTGRPFNTYQWK